MGVSVADDLEVEVVGVPAAGEHGVELLPRFLSGQEAVHGVGGDALGRMDGGGVAETGRLADIVGGESDREVAAGVPDGQVAVLADMGDGPAVAVLDPVGGSESESAVVAAGDDHISDTRLIAVGQTHNRMRHIPVEAMISGAPVEFGDQLAGGGEHDRVKSGRPVRGPGGEGILGGFGYVADMDAIVIQVEGEPRRVAFAEGE